MSEFVDFHVLFNQLQSRYPTSNLISELVETHADRCVVRALVQVGGVTLVTALASAATVEAAEDQARLRVLTLLGIQTSVSRLPNIPPIELNVSSRSSPATFEPSALNSTLLPTPPDVASVGQAASVLPAFEEMARPLPTPPAFDPVFDDSTFSDSRFDDSPFELEEEPIELLSESTSAPSFDNAAYVSNPDGIADIPVDDAPEDVTFNLTSFEPAPAINDVSPDTSTQTRKPGRSKKATAPVQEPLDLSSLIALTDVEMERTGLSKKRGQAYLIETFGKQTRADLDEEQLLDFLNYLRALPSRYQTL